MFKTAIRGLKGQKRISILMAAVLLLSFLFLTLSSVISSSVQFTQQQHREQLYGRYQLLYSSSLQAAEELQAQFPDAQISKIAGTTDNGKQIGTITQKYQEIANLTITEGRLPQNDHEILLVGDDWGVPVGQKIEVKYLYRYLSQNNDNGISEIIRPYYLEGFQKNREYLLAQIEPYWNDFLLQDYSKGIVGPEMLHPLDELSEQQQEQAFSLFASMLPDFQVSSSSTINKENRNFDNLSAQLQLKSHRYGIYGAGFGDNSGKQFETDPRLTAVKIYATYTVCGIADNYAEQWDVQGLQMPNAFIGEQDCQNIYNLMDGIEQDHPEVIPRSDDGLLLYHQPTDNLAQTLNPILDAYNELHNAAYELTGILTEGENTYAYLLGINPDSGEPQAFDVHGIGQMGQITVKGVRQRFNFSDLTNAAFRFEGIDPIPQEPVTLDGLYQNNTGSLRVNPLAFPPVGDTAQTMELALSGVLICMSACASFQLYLQSMRRRKQKISTLIAIGATDGQIVLMLLIEVSVLLLISAFAGCLLGIGIVVYLLPRFMQVTVSFNTTNLLTGTLCNIAAILVGAMLPVFKILSESRRNRKKRTKSITKQPVPQKNNENRTGYHWIWMRHCVATPKQTMLRSLVALLMAAIMILPLFLGHSAYGDYHQKVINQDRPDYELILPYAASSRYLREITDSLDIPNRKMQAYTSAENVLIHCDDLMERSPMLQALYEDNRSSNIFEQLPEGELCVSARILGADWDSDLVQSVLRNCPDQISKDDFQSGKTCIVMIPRYQQKDRTPVFTKVKDSDIADVQSDVKAGTLLELSYLPQYSTVYGTDTSIANGDILTISGWTQYLDEVSGLTDKLYTIQATAACVINELDDAVWPMSDTDSMGGITILSGSPLVSTVYPHASSRKDAQQTAYFWATTELYYPHCYGKTYLQLWSPENVEDTSDYEKQVMDFAATYGFDVVKHTIENQKLLYSAQRAKTMYLMMGINMLVITIILLENLLSAEVEEDRKRIAILQSIGMTDGQYLGGQSIQALLSGLVSLLLTHLLLLLMTLLGLAIAGGGFGLILCKLNLFMQFYPWKTHIILCITYLVLLQILHLQAAIPILRKDPSESLKAQ